MPPTVRTENKYGLDWVLLNNRWYCVQNYSPTHLADGTPIPIVTVNATWAGLTTPARCVYNNSTDEAFIAKYGYLYNWYGVGDGLEMPCSDCTVPSSAEWDGLRDWMIASGFNWDGTTEGNKIGKAVASSGGEWSSSGTEGDVGNNQITNNSSGFTALPGGLRRGSDGAFFFLGLRSLAWGSESKKHVELTNNQELFLVRSDIRGDNDAISIRISRPRAKMFLPPQLIYQGL